jgi:uncharacterized protein (TIGR00730 family)
MKIEPRRITVFCGSAKGARPVYEEATRCFARLAVEQGYGLVYGGGQIGLMGVLAEEALAVGGEVIGVIPRAFAHKELAHEGLTKLYLVETMHERKAKMARLAGAFVALPGGIGTFEELIEIYTWAQIGVHDKALGVLDVENYFEPLFAQLDVAVREGFLKPRFRDILVRERDPDALLSALPGAPRGQLSGLWPKL